MITRIRNKTRGHGAVGPEFWEFACPQFSRALSLLASNNPAMQWNWYHLVVRQKKQNVRALVLRGVTASHVRDEKAKKLRPKLAGLHIHPSEKSDVYHLGDLIEADHECLDYSISNGGYTGRGTAEFLNYASGKLKLLERENYLVTPSPLPQSTTEGYAVVEACENTFGNIPQQISGYVDRPFLQDELLSRLKDKNHSIITLHGRGGIGKTSLALHVVRELDYDESGRFDHLVWFSARDLDLRLDRPVDVRRSVSGIDTIVKNAGALLSDGKFDTDAFASLLQSPTKIGSDGLLFVFDNFETLDDPKDVYRFLDMHTCYPNKVLITSRERAFKGDYPIEVLGMELEEAKVLLNQEAKALGISNIVTSVRMEEIHEYTDGHAYVMRVLLGEIAEECKWIPLKSLVPRRNDLLAAIFEKSFNKLSDDARWAFLLVAGWRSKVSELALLIVLADREYDAERALNTCLKLSLLSSSELPDGTYSYSCPELARIFAKKKRESDPDRLLLEEDLQKLRGFGTLSDSVILSGGAEMFIKQFVIKSFQKAESDSSSIDQIDSTMVRIAEIDGRAWAGVAHFRRKFSSSRKDVAYAFRRAVEEYPSDTDLWLARADVAEQHGENAVKISSLISAVDSQPDDIELIKYVAGELTRYVRDNSIPMRLRGVYLASVRYRMVHIVSQLDATGFSRLAWLFLQEDDADQALYYANKGLALDSTNSHCQKVVMRCSN